LPLIQIETENPQLFASHLAPHRNKYFTAAKIAAE